MKKKEMTRIGFIDSGIGGLVYLQALEKHLRTVKYRDHDFQGFYLADNGAFPYGDKEEEFLVSRLHMLIPAYVKRYSIDILVIACNTASLFIVDSIRKIIKIPVVGVVPAIKPAIALKIPRVFVMNTDASTNSPYIKKMIENPFAQYGYKAQIFLKGCQPLVDAIEQMVLSSDSAHEAQCVMLLAALTDELLALDCGVVVLGCTHFLHIKKHFQSILTTKTKSTNKVIVLDSLEGVVHRTLSLIDAMLEKKESGVQFPYDPHRKFPIHFMYTSSKVHKEKQRLYKALAKRENMVLEKIFVF